MDSSLEIFKTWIHNLRSKQGITTPLIIDAGCTEVATAESEILSKEFIETYLSYNSLTLTHRYGILEPLTTCIFSTYYSINEISSSTNNNNNTSDNEEKHEEEKKDNEINNNENNLLSAVDPLVWKSLILASENNTDVLSLLTTSATHIGIGGAIGPGGHIVITVNLLERRAHILNTDSSSMGGIAQSSGSSVLALKSARILSAESAAAHHHTHHHGIRLTVLAEAGPKVPITNARIMAAPPILEESVVSPIALDVTNLVDPDNNNTEINLPLNNTIVCLRPRNIMCEGEINVYDIPSNNIVHDDEGNTILMVPLTEIYSNPSTCAGRYVIDVYVDESNTTATTVTDNKAENNNTVSESAPAEASESKDNETESKTMEESKLPTEGEAPATDQPSTTENTAPETTSTTEQTNNTSASNSSSTPIFATRFVILVKDHDVTTAVADLEATSIPISVVPTALSEIAVGLGAPEGLPETFLPQTLPIILHPNALARRLPLVACGSATPGIPPISHILLVSGNTEQEAVDQLPPGYEHVPFNVAAELASTLDAIVLSNNNAGNAEPSISGSEDTPTEGSLPAATEAPVEYDVEPPFVFLAVLRDGSGLPCQHMALTAVASLPGISDLPTVTVPHGYSSQMVDIGVRTLGIQGLHDHHSSEADDTASPSYELEPIRRMVRIALAQTTDVDVVNSVASAGTGITIGASSSEGFMNEQSSDHYDTSAEDAEAAAEAAAAAYEADREELIDALQMAVQQQEQLRTENILLQKNLGIYFFNRLSEEDRERTSAALQASGSSSLSATTSGSNAGAVFAAAERDRKYHELLDVVTIERGKTLDEIDLYNNRAITLQGILDEKKARLEAVLRAYQSFKHEIARGAAHSHTGKHLPAALIEKYEQEEISKAEEVADAQLKNIYAAGQVAKIEQELAKREQLGDGLAVIDFEQLKIENTTLQEKIEDRNEEVTKLRKKTQSAVQVLTHVREKLHFVADEVGRLTTELNDIEKQVSEQRTTLANGKKFRDTTRLETIKARQAQGFAYNDRLAIDYEIRKQSVLRRKDELKRLQDIYYSKV